MENINVKEKFINLFEKVIAYNEVSKSTKASIDYSAISSMIMLWIFYTDPILTIKCSVNIHFSITEELFNEGYNKAVEMLDKGE